MATNTALQDQRKRTLEALERRFAVEHLLQQNKNKKSSNGGAEKEPISTSSSIIASAADKKDAAVTPLFDASSKKGFSFFCLLTELFFGLEKENRTLILWLITVFEDLLLS